MYFLLLKFTLYYFFSAVKLINRIRNTKIVYIKFIFIMYMYTLTHI